LLQLDPATGTRRQMLFQSGSIVSAQRIQRVKRKIFGVLFVLVHPFN
jgi:hypothetical protein